VQSLGPTHPRLDRSLCHDVVMKSRKRTPESVPAPAGVKPAKKPLERLREWQGMAEGAYSFLLHTSRAIFAEVLMVA